MLAGSCGSVAQTVDDKIYLQFEGARGCGIALDILSLA